MCTAVCHGVWPICSRRLDFALTAMLTALRAEFDSYLGTLYQVPRYPDTSFQGKIFFKKIKKHKLARGDHPLVSPAAYRAHRSGLNDNTRWIELSEVNQELSEVKAR